MEDENGDLLADFHSIDRWKNYFSQLLNVHSPSEAQVANATVC
jgi:hypothetical protein